MKDERVELTVPAKGEFAKVARMTAAALASRMGMNFDDVDDVRMAVEEAFVYAVDGKRGAGDVTLTFDVGDDAMSISVCVGDDIDASDEEVDRRASLATFILDSVCDRYEFVSEHGGERWLRIHKQATVVDAD